MKIKNISIRMFLAGFIGLVLTTLLVVAGYFIFKGNNTYIIFVSLATIVFLSLIFNYLISLKNKKKLNNMNAEEIIKLIDTSKEYVEKNILSIRHKIINSMRISLINVLLIFALSTILNILSGNILELLYKEKIFELNALLLGGSIGLSLCFYAFISYKLLTPKESLDNTNRYNELYLFVKEIFDSENINDNLVVYIDGFSAACSISKFKNHVYISIGLFLVKFLTKEELKTVIYHEIAHIKHDDNKYLNKLAKINELLYIFANDNTLLWLSPFILKTSLYNAIYDIISTKYYEELADDELLNKNVNETYAKALVKSFGLDYISKYGFNSFYYSFNSNKLTEENMESLFDYILEKYNENIEYFQIVSKKHLEFKVSTHPNIRVRKEKFFKGDINIDISKENNFNKDIEVFIEQGNIHFQKDETFIMQYDHYLEIRNKNIDNIDKVDFYEILNNAVSFMDLDTMYKYGTKLLELNENDNLALYALGIYYSLKHDIKCEEYLLKLIEFNNLYTKASFEMLATFYLETGNVEGRDHLRKIQANLIDNIRGFDSLLELSKNDHLDLFNDNEVINHINEIVKKYKDIKLVSAGVKKNDNESCTHILLVCEDDSNDFETLDKCKQEVFYYLDSLEGQYNLMTFSYSQLMVFRKELSLNPYLIYKK